jgi:hypothetical protein
MVWTDGHGCLVRRFARTRRGNGIEPGCSSQGHGGIRAVSLEAR